MAKWGEGDPRWIVEERPDATNVNNWHWTEKNASQWSKDKLKELLLRVEIDESNIGKCFITEITSIEGEAVANNRKGKLIFFYEWVIKCDWKGCVNGNDEKFSGKLEIPNLSEENSADEVTMDVSVDSTDKEADVLKELMRKQGLKKVQEALSEYIKALRIEFASDMIKPTKLANGGDNSINSFTTDAQEKEKARQHAQEIKRPSTSVPRASSNVGVKIETSTLNLSESFKCTAEEFYRVLTTQEMLQAFTANKAIVNPVAGGRFELLDGNIQGKFIKLTSPNLIKQEWRIRNWPDEHYSQVTINIEQKEDTTQVDIEQIGVPFLELDRTKEGWKRYYFEGIKRTFGFGVSMF